MRMNHKAERWEERYRSGKTGWDRGQVSPALEGWIAAGLIPSGRILVPGCGRGHEVCYLAAQAHDVTAVDIAPSAIAAVREKLDEGHCSAHLIQADLLEWEPDMPFDAIYEQTSLCALDPPDWPEYARRLATWLKPGGRLFALFMQTGREGGPPYHCDLDIMRALFRADLWRWDDAHAVKIEHPSGIHERGFVLARKEVPA